MYKTLKPKMGRIPLYLSFLLLPLFASAQLCQGSFSWKDYEGDQLPDDVSYSTILANPLTMGNQTFNIFNYDPTGGASILNNTIRQELLGGVSDSYILSLNGESTDVVKFKIEFISSVSNVYFNILDIDRHNSGFWQDSLVVKAFSGATRIDIDASNILFHGQAVRFNDSVDALIGIGTSNNPNGSEGNVNFLFPEALDSIIIAYGYGKESDMNMLGNQIIGLDIINFSSDNICTDPVLSPDLVCTELGSGMMTINPLENDKKGDYDFDMSKFRITQNPSNGTVTINGNDMLEYLPANGFKGKDEIKYEICDYNGTCVSSYIELIVRGNASIFAMNDEVALLANTSVSSNVLINDFDVEGDYLVIQPASIIQPSNGSFQLDANGEFVYTPNSGFSGRDIAQYTICKQATPTICDIAEIHFYVQSVILHNVPSFLDIDDEIYMYKGESMYFDVSKNLGFLPVTSSNYMFDIHQNPANGTVTITDDGMLKYIGDFGYCGADRLEYSITDMSTGETHIASTMVHVMEDYMRCDDHITVASTDFGYMYEDGLYTGNLTDNDFQGMLLPYSVNQNLVVNPQNGSVILNEDGSYAYTPNPGFFGSDRFSYEICYRSADDQEYPFEQNATNLPYNLPNGNALGEHTMEINEEGTINNIELNNISIDHSNISDITVRLVSPSGLSAVVFQNVCSGYANMKLNFSDNAFQSVLPCPATNDGNYKPKESFSKFIGEDIEGEWKLVITDIRTQSDATTLLDWKLETSINGHVPLDCKVANVEMLVMPNAEAPVANEDCIEVIDPSQVSILDVLGNDTDHNNDIDPSTLKITSFPSHGAATVLSNGDLYFKTHDDFEGIQNFTYEICDTLGLCSSANIKVMVAVALAIDFTELEVSLDRNNTPFLEWTVNQDHTAYSFEVERSLSGYDNFENIGLVSADQNEHQYGFYDENLSNRNSRVYYRIKALDIDGTTKYTDVVSLNLNNDSNVEVYPNPFADRITVNLDNDTNSPIDFELYSIDGMLITKQMFFTSQYTIDISGLNIPTGQYQYRINSDVLIDSGLLIKR